MKINFQNIKNRTKKKLMRKRQKKYKTVFRKKLLKMKALKKFDKINNEFVLLKKSEIKNTNTLFQKNKQIKKKIKISIVIMKLNLGY